MSGFSQAYAGTIAVGLSRSHARLFIVNTTANKTAKKV